MIKITNIKKLYTVIIICLVLLANFLSISALGEEADNLGVIKILSAKLPSERGRTSAIWDGSNAYIFGGMSVDEETLPVLHDEIIKFNPKTNEIEILDTVLPTNRSDTSAIWDGSYAYIIGGESIDGDGYGETLDETIRFTPGSDTVEEMYFIRLPYGRLGTSAIYDGNNAYIFGGIATNQVNEIVSVNFSNSEEFITSTDLPNWTQDTSAIWDGNNAYIFGGGGYPGKGHIIRYDPVNNIVNITNARMPKNRYRLRTSAIWDGNFAYIFGGVYREDGEWVYSDEILRYDPINDNITIMPTRLPFGREGTSAVWTGERAYIFGGYMGGGEFTDQIIEYTPPKVQETETNDDTDNDFLFYGILFIFIMIIATSVLLIRRRFKRK